MSSSLPRKVLVWPHPDSSNHVTLIYWPQTQATPLSFLHNPSVRLQSSIQVRRRDGRKIEGCVFVLVWGGNAAQERFCFCKSFFQVLDIVLFLYYFLPTMLAFRSILLVFKWTVDSKRTPSTATKFQSARQNSHPRPPDTHTQTHTA